MNTNFRLMPEQASSVAGEVDQLYALLVLVSLASSLGIAAAIVYFAVKYRRGSRADRGGRTGHALIIELIWILLPLALTVFLFAWGARLFFDEARAPAGAIQIDCVAKQWMWKFQHPEGPAEIDDLHLPLGQSVQINMISEDVIHSLYVPAFRIKHDVLPGRYTSVWFQPTKAGQYHLFCAEYCGAKHSAMGGRVIVLEPSQYQAWLEGGNRNETPLQLGRRLFAQLGCETCHRGAGAEGRGPPLEGLFGSTIHLRGGQTVVADEQYIRESILRPAARVVAGYEPIMPSYQGQVGEEGVLALIAEIKSRSRPPREQAGRESSSPSRVPPAPSQGAPPP